MLNNIGGATTRTFVKGSDPIPGDVFLGIKLLGCFPRGYFVLLGIRGIFELLRQVISPCPKTCRSLRYENEYQHCIKNPNTVVVVRPICPEMYCQFSFSYDGKKISTVTAAV